MSLLGAHALVGHQREWSLHLEDDLLSLAIAQGFQAVGRQLLTRENCHA